MAICLSEKITTTILYSGCRRRRHCPHIWDVLKIVPVPHTSTYHVFQYGKDVYEITNVGILHVHYMPYL
jgi:hypothetical protein